MFFIPLLHCIKKLICVAANSCQNPVVVSDVLRGLIPGGQTGFYQHTNSTLQAVQQPAPSAQQLHQTGSPYNLQGYGTQSAAATPVGLQNFGSQVTKLWYCVAYYTEVSNILWVSACLPTPSSFNLCQPSGRLIVPYCHNAFKNVSHLEEEDFWHTVCSYFSWGFCDCYRFICN
jgi:hypothetical protein